MVPSDWQFWAAWAAFFALAFLLVVLARELGKQIAVVGLEIRNAVLASAERSEPAPYPGFQEVVEAISGLEARLGSLAEGLAGWEKATSAAHDTVERIEGELREVSVLLSSIQGDVQDIALAQRPPPEYE